MASDIVERLLSPHDQNRDCPLCKNDSVAFVRCGRGECAWDAAVRKDAADETAALRARVAKLEAAARGILDDYEHIDTDLTSVQALRRALEPRDGR